MRDIQISPSALVPFSCVCVCAHVCVHVCVQQYHHNQLRDIQLSQMSLCPSLVCVCVCARACVCVCMYACSSIITISGDVQISPSALVPFCCVCACMCVCVHVCMPMLRAQRELYPPSNTTLLSSGTLHCSCLELTHPSYQTLFLLKFPVSNFLRPCHHNHISISKNPTFLDAQICGITHFLLQ